MPALLRWFAPYLLTAGAAIGAGIGLWLYVTHVDRSARAEQKAADRVAVERAQSQQAMADLKRVLASERRRTDITETSNAMLSDDLAGARAGLAAYVGRLRDKPAQGEWAGTGVPTLPDAAALDQRSGEGAVVYSAGDLEICAENSIRLINAQSWFREQEKVLP